MTASELLGVHELSRRLGISTERIRQLRFHNAFPEPNLPAGPGRPALWRWARVERWAKRTGRLP